MYKLPPGLYPAKLLCPWNSPGKNTGLGCHSLLQGIFLTQGANAGVSHSRHSLHHLSHQEIPISAISCDICLSLTDFTGMIISTSTYVAANDIILFFFMAE